MPAASVPTRNHHSAFAPENLTTLAHLSVSDAMNAAEIGYRQRHRLAAKIDKPTFELRIGERCVDHFVQRRHNGRWCSLGRPDPKPCGSLVARQKLANCRRARAM